ncbi:MAG: arylsulfatase [Porticoccaceae bacterium]|nr:arylsulfatase [Porticoccaceae bacterium]
MKSSAIIFSAITSLTLVVISVGDARAGEATFDGVIAKTGAASTPSWPAPASPPKGAPNVLIWLMDDVGYGHLANFGGLVETPRLDRLADSGLRFSNFHATPLCSPTRASLLTGRNPHAVGMGSHANTPTGYPGYNARIPRSAASIGRILRDQGYATYALGKWDQLPTEHTSPEGPFDYWPSGQGFEHFYGFLTYDTHHFQPLLWRDHTPVAPPDNPGYHLTADLADQAISWLRGQHSINPDQPFLMYWSTGAVHAPHHAPKAYIDKYRGKFDMGWNAARRKILERQKRLGLVPVDAELPPWPDNVPRWDSLTADEKRMAARAMEAFAGMLDHADEQFGRIVDALRETGQLENTLIIVVSDNGASAEGGLAGSYNELLMGQVGWQENLSFLEQWGQGQTYPHYPVGWAAAGNTPFKYYKQSAFEGGNRVPMIVSWPKGIGGTGAIRDQYHHVSDILPTVLEIIGITSPDTVAGVRQQPIDGVSFRYALSNPDAPTRKKVQYYEMWGNHGLWAEGWKANVQLREEPWNVFSKVSLADAEWELYHVEEDFNERHNLARENPDKLAAMQALFDKVAWQNNVYPLLPDFITEAYQRQMDWLHQRQGRFVLYPGTGRLPHPLAPPVNLFGFSATGALQMLDEPVDGVVFAFGGNAGGYALYLEEGVPVFAHNHVGASTRIIKADRPLPSGPVALALKLEKTGATTGELVISVNGSQVATGALANLGVRLPSHETFDIGRDWGSTVVDYRHGNGIMPAGVIEQVVFDMELPNG